MKHSDLLISSALAKDPRVAQAKLLLAEALTEHASKINKIAPAKEALKQSYEQMIASFNNLRGGKLWFPYLGSGLGNGVFVELADGSIKYDFIGGIGVHYLGHNHKALLEPLVDAALSNTVMQGHLQQNVDAYELTKSLVELSGFDHCFLSTSGAMACENALKIAFQKHFPKNRILAFEGCFMGRTLALSQITDKPAFREGLPNTVEVDYLPFFDPKRPEDSTANALNTLKTHLKRYPKQHAVMCLEFIQGEGGFRVGEKSFFKAIMQVLKEQEIAVFADEVQTFARTPKLFAYQYFELSEMIDIATLGKLGQVCATLFTEKYKPKPGLLSQTFISSTAAIKSAKAILEHLQTGNYFGDNGKINQIHAYFETKLQELAKRHPDLVEGPFGLGSMVAFTPYGGDHDKVNAFIHRLFEAGVISFIAGSGSMTRVRFLLPIGAIEKRHIDEVISLIEKNL